MTDEGASDYCAWHHRREAAGPDTFRVCFECGHVFASREAMLDAIIQTDREAGEAALVHGYAPPRLLVRDEIDVDAWPFCPYCIHDF